MCCVVVLVHTYMLVDQYYPHIFALLREPCECLFYFRGFSLMIHDKEIPLGIGRLGNVANARKQ